MKPLLKVALWVAGIVAFCSLLYWADKSDQEDCEVRIAQELNTTAKYIDGKCMVKGYGSMNGR